MSTSDESNDNNLPAKRGIAGQLMFLVVAAVVGVAVYFGAKSLIYNAILQSERAKATAPANPQPLSKPLQIEDI